MLQSPCSQSRHLLKFAKRLPNCLASETVYAPCYPSSPRSKRASNGPEWMHNMRHGITDPMGWIHSDETSSSLDRSLTGAPPLVPHTNHSHPLSFSRSHPTYTIHAPPVVLWRTNDPNNPRGSERASVRCGGDAESPRFLPAAAIKSSSLLALEFTSCIR